MPAQTPRRIAVVLLAAATTLSCRGVGGESQRAESGEMQEDTQAATAELAEYEASAESDAAAAEPAESEPSLLRRIFKREPETVTVPSGTVLTVRFLEGLSSHTSAPGEWFRAAVTQEVSAGGRVAVPDGSHVLGSVTDAHAANKIGGRAILSLRFHTLELPGGESVPISASFAQRGRSETPKDAAIIGGSTLGGVVLGEAIDEGEGGIVGAIVGGIAGAVGAKRTRGRPVQVPAGTVMSIELTGPVTVTLA